MFTKKINSIVLVIFAIKSLKVKRLITLNCKYIQVIGFKVNPISPISPALNGISCLRVFPLSHTSSWTCRKKYIESIMSSFGYLNLRITSICWIVVQSVTWKYLVRVYEICLTFFLLTGLCVTMACTYYGVDVPHPAQRPKRHYTMYLN